MNIIDLLKRIRPFIYPYRYLVLFTLILTFIASLTAQINAWVLRYTVDHVNILISENKGLKEGINVLIIISTILLSKEILNIFIQYGQKFYGEKLRILVSQELAQNVVDKILTFKMAFFSKSKNAPGKLQTRIDRGVESITRLIQNFFIDILPLFAGSFIALIMMFVANFYVGLIGLFIVPIYFYISQLQAKKISGFRRNIRKFRENKSHGILGILESMLVIKSFNREEIESKKQLSLQKNLTDFQMKTRKTSFFFDGLKSFVEQIGIVLIIILTVYFVLIGQMSIGMIMFHIMLFNNVSAPIRQLHRIYDEMNDALIYSEGFFDILDSDQIEKTGTYKPEKIQGKFELKNINFTYPNQTKALTNVNMIISPNTITALVGLSGAGKSTIVNLLDKFYEPDSGELLLDGIPLSEYDTEFLRDNIGLVLQKNHIFQGSIAENIKYGNPQATEEQMIEAAKQAYIHEQILLLPDKYDTNALSLSGGQQQRIAIARMFLKNPPIIFLDEPTASLDAIATEQIKNSLDAIKKDRTVVIISHSISQIIDSEKIYVMKNGNIMESGTHEEVYQMDGTYKEIFDSMARSLNLDKISKTLNDRNE